MKKYDYTFSQGETALIPVSEEGSTFVMSDGMNKQMSEHIISTDDGLAFELPSYATSGFVPGIYKYQVIAPNGSVASQGSLKVSPCLLYSNSLDSYWRTVLKAVEMKLAGKADDSVDSVTVGDKSLHYMSIDELMKLRDFALKKIAEEEDGAVSPNDARRIRYVWGLR